MLGSCHAEIMVRHLELQQRHNYMHFCTETKIHFLMCLLKTAQVQAHGPMLRKVSPCTNRYTNSNSQEQNSNNDEHYSSATCKIWSNRWTAIKMQMLYELWKISSNLPKEINKHNTYTFLQCGHLARALFSVLNCKWKWTLQLCYILNLILLSTFLL